MNREILIKVNENSDIDVLSMDQFTSHEVLCLAASLIICAAKIDGVRINKMKRKIGKYVEEIWKNLK